MSHLKSTGSLLQSPVINNEDHTMDLNNEFLLDIDNLNEFNLNNHSTSNTTPEFHSPPNKELLSNNYSYDMLNQTIDGSAIASTDYVTTNHRPTLGSGSNSVTPNPGDSSSSTSIPTYHHHSSSFNLPDQLNSLSLKPLSSNPSSKSPSPDLTQIFNKDDYHDERTINPKQLINSTNGSPLALKSNKGYILPSSSSSPNLSTFFRSNKSTPGSRRPQVSNHLLETNFESNFSGDTLDLSGGNHLTASTNDHNDNNDIPNDNSKFDSINRNNKSGRPSKSDKESLAIQSSRFPSKPSASPTGPSMSTQNHHASSPNKKSFDFQMNNECFNAISYWLNNNLNNSSQLENKEIIINPTGIIKNNYYKRRNSIQMINPSAYIDENNSGGGRDDDDDNNNNNGNSNVNQKRKRRKSYNYGAIQDNNVSEIRNSLMMDNQAIKLDMSEISELNNGSDGLNIEGLNDIMNKGGNYDSEAAHSSNGDNTDNMDVNANGNTINMNMTMNMNMNMELDSESQPQESNTNGTTNQVMSSGLHIGPGRKPEKATEKFPPIEIGEQEEGKPFPCPDCPKQFKRSEHLKRHIRSVHSNIRPFHCKYCEKQFSRSDNLAQHLKTHYKVNSNGTTSIIYGNPNLHNRGGRRKNSSSAGTSN